ncbi:MAG: hypothetical protein N3E51_02515 [Candidatus Micrarchaeota archaeon]|nr:hypothetical protein [Candidatus Micrarchaeota archaeon]
MARVFLLEKSDVYRLYSVRQEGLLPSTYIICSAGLRKVLYSPQLAGNRLLDAMEKNAQLFAKLLQRRVLAKAKRATICELVFLSGGLYYALNSGFRRLFGYALPQCFIGIQRQRVEGTQGQFRAVCGYENFESLPDKANIIIGDTIATGSTLVRGIQLLLDAAESKGYSLESISVVSLAASTEGARKLASLAKNHIFRQHPSCKVSLFASEMLFHLMPDGTDLRFLMPNSIMPPESRREALLRYGGYLSKNMKCAVFDWGTRCKNPALHWKEFLEFASAELESGKMDAKGILALKRMKREAEESLSAMRLSL